MIPNLTTEQRRENLEKAKAARQRRHAILKGVADGGVRMNADSVEYIISFIFTVAMLACLKGEDNDES